MKIKRILLAIVLALAVLLSQAAPASAADETAIVRQLINYFYYHQEKAETDIYRLLQELEEISPDKAARWTAIMEDWLWTQTDLDLRSGVLPEGLPDDNSLCIVVLGYQLTSSGKMRTELVGRMQVALQAAQQYPNAYIIVTGGATASNNKSATEAGRMADWLRSNGIASSRIIEETQAYSTEANAINCLRLLDQSYPQVKHLVMVTSDYHMQYSYMLFSARQQLGYGGRMDMVGAACYDTSKSSGFGYATQASAIAAIAGVNVENMGRPTLSQASGLAVLGDTVYGLGDELDLSATAIYDSGMMRDVTDKAVFSAFDPSALGMQTITVAYEENGTRLETTIDILVQEEDDYVPLPSQAVNVESWETVPVENTEVPEEETAFSPASLLWLLLLIPIGWTVYELHERHQRILRRRRRRRKKIIWE